MSVDKIISTVIEGLEDEDDLKDVALSGALKDEDIKYWSQHMRSSRFGSEEEARQKLFDLLQHSDKTPGPFEPWGESRNRYFSQAMPVYQDRFGTYRIGAPLMTWAKAKRQAANQRRGKWERKQKYLARKKDLLWFIEHGATPDRIVHHIEGDDVACGGRYTGDVPQFKTADEGQVNCPACKLVRLEERSKDPDVLGEAVADTLHEYAQGNSFSSDFSDGTGGEPSAPAPFTQGTGEHPGLPDYKYLERQAKWKKKLKALIQRRDPDGIEQRIGESEEDDFDIKEVAGPEIRYEKAESAFYSQDYHHVRVIYPGDNNYDPGDFFLGAVWRTETPGSRPKVPAMLKLDQEFPWTAQPVSYQYSGRARFRTMEEAGNWLYAVRFKLPSAKLRNEFTSLWMKIPLGGHVREGMDDEDDLKDLNPKTPVITVDEFVHAYQAIPLPVYGRNAFFKHFFGTREDQKLLQLMKEHKLDGSHVWTVYCFTARPREVYIVPNMKYPGGSWSLDHVFGWFLTKLDAGGAIYQMDPRDVRDNNVEVL